MPAVNGMGPQSEGPRTGRGMGQCGRGGGIGRRMGQGFVRKRGERVGRFCRFGQPLNEESLEDYKKALEEELATVKKELEEAKSG